MYEYSGFEEFARNRLGQDLITSWHRSYDPGSDEKFYSFLKKVKTPEVRKVLADIRHRDAVPEDHVFFLQWLKNTFNTLEIKIIRPFLEGRIKVLEERVDCNNFLGAEYVDKEGWNMLGREYERVQVGFGKVLFQKRDIISSQKEHDVSKVLTKTHDDPIEDPRYRIYRLASDRAISCFHNAGILSRMYVAYLLSPFPVEFERINLSTVQRKLKYALSVEAMPKECPPSPQ